MVRVYEFHFLQRVFDCCRAESSKTEVAFGERFGTAPETRLIMIGILYEREGPARRWARYHNLDAG
jgi:hypothetical protein